MQSFISTTSLEKTRTIRLQEVRLYCTGTRSRTLQLPSRRPGSGEVATDGIRLYSRSNTAAALNQPSINFSTTELSLPLTALHSPPPRGRWTDRRRQPQQVSVTANTTNEGVQSKRPRPQQQTRQSTTARPALSINCEQCHVVSWR